MVTFEGERDVEKRLLGYRSVAPDSNKTSQHMVTGAERRECPMWIAVISINVKHQNSVYSV